jgi:ribonuclease HI
MAKEFKNYRFIKSDLSWPDFVAYIGGACAVNPGGPCGMGVEITSHRRRFSDYSTTLRTNNQAEYAALVMALKKADEFGARKVMIFTDARVLCRRTKPSIARAHHPHLIALNREALELAAGFDRFVISWIPREQNKVADRLSKRGLDRALAASGGAVQRPADGTLRLRTGPLPANVAPVLLTTEERYLLHHTSGLKATGTVFRNPQVRCPVCKDDFPSPDAYVSHCRLVGGVRYVCNGSLRHPPPLPFSALSALRSYKNRIDVVDALGDSTLVRETAGASEH